MTTGGTSDLNQILFLWFILVSAVMCENSEADQAKVRVKRGFGCPLNAQACHRHCKSIGRRGGYCAGDLRLTCTCYRRWSFGFKDNIYHYLYYHWNKIFILHETIEVPLVLLWQDERDRIEEMWNGTREKKINWLLIHHTSCEHTNSGKFNNF